MDLQTFQLLLSEEGQKALAEAMALEPTEELFLAHYEKLRKRHPSALAKAALEMTLLRIKARKKFSTEDDMYFDREALEQASGEIPANHRARRLAPYGVIADLCCGLGGDALAFARMGLTVHAVESDPIRAAMTRANAIADRK